MRNLQIPIYFFFVLSVFLSCQKEAEKLPQPVKNIFLNESPKGQIFEIGIVNDTLLVGEQNTVIKFKRSDYELSKSAPVTIILKEVYDFGTIVRNGISTITNQNQLLETSGVFYIEVKSGEKTVPLKKGKYLEVIPPIKEYNDNTIFSAIVDSLGNFHWKLESMKAKIQIHDTIRNEQYGILIGYFMDKIISLDSVSFYEEWNKKWEIKMKNRIVQMDTITAINVVADFPNGRNTTASSQNNSNIDISGIDDYLENINSVSLFLNDYNWYNIDRFVQTNVSMNIEIQIKNLETQWFNTYVLYDELKSVVYQVHYGNKSSLTKIPLLENTRLIVTTDLNGKLYYQQINLEKDKSVYEVNMKETTLEALEKLLLKK